MAEVPYGRFNSDIIHDLTPHYKGGDEPPGGDVLEARVAKLETDLEYVKRDVSELRTDMRDVRDRLTRIEEQVSALPSKAFVFSVYGVVAALIVAVTLFQAQIQQAVGIVSPPV
jgi:hypothetical protein